MFLLLCGVCSASCSPGAGSSCLGGRRSANAKRLPDLPSPYQTVAVPFFGTPNSSVSAVPPTVSIWSGCPSKLDLDPVTLLNVAAHTPTGDCRSTVATDMAQLTAVSKAVEGTEAVVRRSLRAEPGVVSVEWTALKDALVEASEALWPGEGRALDARLQAVLTYGEGDSFGRHVDRCEDSRQEGVLILDLGFRDGGDSPYNASIPEMFFHKPSWTKPDWYSDSELTRSLAAGAAGDFAGEWAASGPGSWVVFPMHHPHGVYQRLSTRAVAVFTLLDLSRPWNGFCFGSSEVCGSCERHLPTLSHEITT